MLIFSTGSFFLGFFLGVVFFIFLTGMAMLTLWIFNYYKSRLRRYLQYKSDNDNNLQVGDGDHYEFKLSGNSSMESNEFQEKWEHIQTFRKEKFGVITEEGFVELLQKVNIFCIASGTVGEQIKYYMYGRDSIEPVYFLLEVVIAKNTKNGQLVLKTNSDKDSQTFIDTFLNAIAPIVTVSM